MESKLKSGQGGSSPKQTSEDSPYWLSRAIEVQVARAIPEIVRSHAAGAAISAGALVGPALKTSARRPRQVVRGEGGRDPSSRDPADPPSLARHQAGAPAESEVVAAALCGIAGDHQGLRNIVTGLRARAVPVAIICLDLIGAAARHLGDRWAEDEVNFVEVTFATGVFEAALRELLPVLEAELAAAHTGSAEVGRILLAGLSQDSHRLGLTMIGSFFRGAGWQVRDGLGLSLQELERIVSVEWFEVIGMSASCDVHIDLLSFTLGRIRRKSCNPGVGFLVGGPLFVEQPSLVSVVGADATAADAYEALRQAERIRSRSRKTSTHADS